MGFTKLFPLIKIKNPTSDSNSKVMAIFLTLTLTLSLGWSRPGWAVPAAQRNAANNPGGMFPYSPYGMGMPLPMMMGGGVMSLLFYTFVYPTAMEASKKVFSTFWDSWFLSTYYPRIKREAQKNSVPDAYFMAAQAQSNGLKINDLILDRKTHIKLNTYILSLKSAIQDNRPLPMLLLYGLPGTGKTEVAKRLTAEGDFELKLFSGGSLMRLQPQEFEHVFHWVDKPHDKKIIVFIDEAETLLKKGFARRSDHLQTFLTATGSGSPHFTVVAATNYVEEFDEAAHRRFHFQVEMPLPQKTERPKVFQYYFSRFSKNNLLSFENDFLNQEEALNSISDASDGLSGSAIENICLNVAGEAQLFHESVVRLDMVLAQIKDHKDEAMKLASKKDEAEKKRKESAKFNYLETMGQNKKLDEIGGINPLDLD